MHPWIVALLGGAMIGIASALVLLTHGRIAGISGIVGSVFRPSTTDGSWRLAFVTGLVAMGVVATLIAPAAIGPPVPTLPLVIVAGLLVGYGTQLGSGCTSGHGVCGMSRLSIRSLVAVVVFMASGAVTATVTGGGS